MPTGIKLQAHPTQVQSKILNQWIGCARYIWNAKTHEEKALRPTLNKEDTYPKIDRSYAHFKNKENTAWLYDVPSVILRNSIVNWYKTYQNFFQTLCRRPRHKKKYRRGSVCLTRELFAFVKGEDKVTRLLIGNKKHNIGFLSIKNHRKYTIPNALYIRKKHNKYGVSFCYETYTMSKDHQSQKAYLKRLKKQGERYLERHTMGIDRGVVRPVQCAYSNYGYQNS